MAKLTTSQIAAQIGVSERTIQRWIAEGKLPAQPIARRQYLVAESDIEALRPSQVDEVISHTEERIQALESRIEALERRVNDLETQLERKTPAPSQPRILRPSAPTYETRDEDTVTARYFAEAHGFTRDRMDGWIKQKAFPTTPTPYGKRVQHQLNLDQQRTVLLYWQEHHIPFGPCTASSCPCHETPTQ